MATTKTAAGELKHLKLSELKPATDNPRRNLGDLKELVESLKSLGMLQPIVAVQTNGHFTIVAGHRRFAAAKLAGLDAVDVVVKELDEPDRIAAMLVENLQRSDLSALEEARAYERLVEECGLTQRAIASKVSRSQGHVSKRLMLLSIPAPAAAALDSGGITLEEALELAKLHDDPKRQQHAWSQRGQVYGGLAKAVEEELEFKQRDDLIDAEEAKLVAKGVRIVRFTRPATRWQAPELPKGAVEIAASGGWDALKLDPHTHAKEPCHAVAVRVSRTTGGKAELVNVCTDRKRHPKAKRGSERERDHRYTESAAQKDSRELGKVRDTRRAFAATVVRGRLDKGEHAELVLETLIESAHSEVLKVACKLVGLAITGGNGQRDFGAYLRKYATSPAKRQEVELAIAFGTREELLSSPWAPWDERDRAYIRLLERHGYKLTPIENKKLGRKAKAAA